MERVWLLAEASMDLVKASLRASPFFDAPWACLYLLSK
jgi:hypothetical protein